MMNNPFTPGATVNIASLSGTSQAVALATGSTACQVMITSPAATVLCFIKFGSSSAVAAVAATDTPIMPGTQTIFSVPVGTTHVAAIGTSGVLYATTGNGI